MAGVGPNYSSWMKPSRSPPDIVPAFSVDVPQRRHSVLLGRPLVRRSLLHRRWTPSSIGSGSNDPARQRPGLPAGSRSSGRNIVTSGTTSRWSPNTCSHLHLPCRHSARAIDPYCARQSKRRSIRDFSPPPAIRQQEAGLSLTGPTVVMSSVDGERPLTDGAPTRKREYK